MKLTMAFPKGWRVQNERDRLLITKKKELLMQVTVEKRPEKQAPREFLLHKLRGASIARGEALAVNGMEGYAVRSEEHTSELQSRLHLVCRLLLEKKNTH